MQSSCSAKPKHWTVLCFQKTNCIRKLQHGLQKQDEACCFTLQAFATRQLLETGQKQLTLDKEHRQAMVSIETVTLQSMLTRLEHVYVLMCPPVHCGLLLNLSMLKAEVAAFQ